MSGLRRLSTMERVQGFCNVEENAMPTSDQRAAVVIGAAVRSIGHLA
jgi:hypothetical protein